MSHSLPFLPTYPRPSLTSACHLMSIYVLCSVYGNKNEFTLYTIFTELYNSTGVKMSRYVRSTSKNKLFYHIPPISIPTSNRNLPGRCRGRRHPPAAGWSICQSLRRCFSRLTLLPRELSINSYAILSCMPETMTSIDLFIKARSRQRDAEQTCSRRNRKIRLQCGQTRSGMLASRAALKP